MRVGVTLLALAGSVWSAQVATAASSALDGRWRIVQVANEDVPRHTKPHTYLDFRGERIGASAGCNASWGAYTASERTLKIEIEASTVMGCRYRHDSTVMSREDRLLELLGQVRSYRVSRRRAVLKTAGGDLVRLTRAPGADRFNDSYTPTAPGAPPARALVDPQWAQVPSPEDLARLYPKSGGVQLVCRATPSGELYGCMTTSVPVEPTPAAAELAKLHRLSPDDAELVAQEKGSVLLTVGRSTGSATGQ